MVVERPSPQIDTMSDSINDSGFIDLDDAADLIMDISDRMSDALNQQKLSH